MPVLIPLTSLLDDVISLHDDDSIVVTDSNQPVTMPSRAHLIPGVDTAYVKYPSSFYAVDIHTGFLFKAKGECMVE